MFRAAWFSIGIISAIDAYLVLRFQNVIVQMECNPIGRLLLEWDPLRPSLFVAAKFLGTIVVLGCLVSIYQAHRRIGHLMACTIAAFQFLLLGWMVLS